MQKETQKKWKVGRKDIPHGGPNGDKGSSLAIVVLARGTQLACRSKDRIYYRSFDFR